MTANLSTFHCLNFSRALNLNFKLICYVLSSENLSTTGLRSFNKTSLISRMLNGQDAQIVKPLFGHSGPQVFFVEKLRSAFAENIGTLVLSV